MKEKDELLAKLRKEKEKSPFRKFFTKPGEVIRERPLRLIYISLIIALGFSFAAYFILRLSVLNIIIFAALISIVPPGMFDAYEKSRVRKLEAEFPTLLRDISSSRKAGMSIEDAVSVAAGGEYGKLTSAIRWIDSLMSWGITFEEALARFQEKYPTPLIKRSVSVILEASRAGGEIGDILEAVADDAREVKTLVGKRAAETMPYTIICYLSFFVFIAIIVVISFYLIPVLEEVAKAPVAVRGMGFRASARDIEMYKTLFFHALIIQGFFTGIITGKIGEGRITAGLKHSIILVVIAIITYSLI